MENECKLISLGGGKVVSTPWKRSKINYDTSYDRMHNDYEESLKFIAKRNVMFTGIMWFREYNGADFNLKIRYKVNNGETSEVIDVNLTDSDRNMEDPWKVHYIDFQDYGIEPIPL
jgi:hypothetical protein